MRPRLRSIMPGSTARVALAAPIRLRSIMRRNIAASLLRKGALSAPPALATRHSIGPRAATAQVGENRPRRPSLKTQRTDRANDGMAEAMTNWEVEYDNRARTPGFATIVARWGHDAAAFRAKATASSAMESDVSYGATP